MLIIKYSMTPTDDFYAWIERHAGDDPTRLRLKYGKQKVVDLDYAAAVTQIECRRKFAKKLAHTLASMPRFYFPSALAGEQATSDLVAAFHASLVGEGASLVDLTAGLGIDVIHCAERASDVTAIERDFEKVDALRYNAKLGGIDNIEIIQADCRDYIAECIAAGRHFDVAFIDPARRASDGSRVFALADCEPAVVELLPLLAKVCNRLIIKVSPMLDIAHTVAELTPFVESITAVGTASECKELLAVANFRSAGGEPTVAAVTLNAAAPPDVFEFKQSEEYNCAMPPVMTDLSEGNFVYEASPAMMKSGVFKLLAERYGLSVFHSNTRLFSSKVLAKAFPGMSYRVLRVFPYASRVLKRFAREYPAVNVAVRNFGMSADALRSKLGVRDGGSLRLYGITDSRGEKMLVLVEKVSV